MLMPLLLIRHAARGARDAAWQRYMLHELCHAATLDITRLRAAVAL